MCSGRGCGPCWQHKPGGRLGNAFWTRNTVRSNLTTSSVLVVWQHTFENSFVNQSDVDIRSVLFVSVIGNTYLSYGVP